MPPREQQLGLHVGSLVRVRIGRRLEKKPPLFRVVGTVVFGSSLTTGGLGNGALFTLPGLLKLAGRCPASPQQQACFVKTVIGDGGAFLVRGVPGSQGRSRPDASGSGIFVGRELPGGADQLGQLR